MFPAHLGTFSDTGMHFYFSPYEIAPYVVGEVDIEIPHAELRGHPQGGILSGSNNHI